VVAGLHEKSERPVFHRPSLDGILFELGGGDTQTLNVWDRPAFVARILTTTVVVPAARIRTTASDDRGFALVHAITFSAPFTRVKVEVVTAVPLGGRGNRCYQTKRRGMHGIGGHHRPMVAADSTTPRRAKKVRNLSTARLTRFLPLLRWCREHRRLPAGCALRNNAVRRHCARIARWVIASSSAGTFVPRWNPIQRRW